MGVIKFYLKTDEICKKTKCRNMSTNSIKITLKNCTIFNKNPIKITKTRQNAYFVENCKKIAVRKLQKKIEDTKIC